jgi:hypothetical protein
VEPAYAEFSLGGGSDAVRGVLGRRRRAIRPPMRICGPGVFGDSAAQRNPRTGADFSDVRITASLPSQVRR